MFGTGSTFPRCLGRRFAAIGSVVFRLATAPGTVTVLPRQARWRASPVWSAEAAAVPLTGARMKSLSGPASNVLSQNLYDDEVNTRTPRYRARPRDGDNLGRVPMTQGGAAARMVGTAADPGATDTPIVLLTNDAAPPRTLSRCGHKAPQ